MGTGRSVIVACHPDDEAIWFAGVAARVDAIVLIHGDSPIDPGIGRRRRVALAAHPDRGRLTALDIPEPGLFKRADWSRPELGLTFADAECEKRAVETVGTLMQVLLPHLADAEVVFTHGPWGEYGHEEHVLLHIAVRNLAALVKFRVWCSNYSGPRNAHWPRRLADRFDTEPLAFACDRAWAEGLRDLYAENECWTWIDGWICPDRMPMVRLKETPGG